MVRDMYLGPHAAHAARDLSFLFMFAQSVSVSFERF